jgi:hypothetical protein
LVAVGSFPTARLSPTGPAIPTFDYSCSHHLGLKGNGIRPKILMAGIMGTIL